MQAVVRAAAAAAGSGAAGPEVRERPSRWTSKSGLFVYAHIYQKRPSRLTYTHIYINSAPHVGRARLDFSSLSLTVITLLALLV